MNKINVAVIGAGSRGNVYARYAETNPHAMAIVAVADPQKHLRDKMKNQYNIPKENVFETYDDFFAKGVIADALIIATQDDMHFDPCMKAMEVGYKYILLEKPISPSLEECIILDKTAKEKGVNIQVCHVLRYAPFYRKLKEVIDSGVIGDIVTINHTEGVQFEHQAHSFVRGDWRNSETSSPMILAKCCHDMDLLLFLTGLNCIELSSYGSNYLFREENAPKGSTNRCIEDCKVKATCPYNAMKIYGDRENWKSKIAIEKKNYPDLATAMTEGEYGRCVYRCDNNVVDHQVVNLLMDNDVTAHLTMTAFQNGRKTNIGGTMGEITAIHETFTITVTDYRTKDVITYNVATNNSGHGGSDQCTVEDFVKTVKGQSNGGTNISISLQSHALCHAAETSRLEKRNIKINELLK